MYGIMTSSSTPTPNPAPSGTQNHHHQNLLSTFSLSESCPIHFGPLKPGARALPCGHKFCFDCLKPYASANTNRIVCPVCNTVHKTDISLLPSSSSSKTTISPETAATSSSSLSGYLLGALPASAEKHVTKSKALSTLNALKNAESACDMAMELLESMKDDFRAMKTSFETKRESIKDELNQLDQQQQHSSSAAGRSPAAMSEEEKSAESRALSTACDVLQRVCAMAHDRAFHQILQVSNEIEQVSQQVKSIGLCRYSLYSEDDLEESLEKRIIELLAFLVQRHSSSSGSDNCNNYSALCENMIREFPEKFGAREPFGPSEGAFFWTALVGDRSLVWKVPCQLLVQGWTSSTKMVVYCSRSSDYSNPTGASKSAAPATHKLGMRLSQVRFKSIIENEHHQLQRGDQKNSRKKEEALVTAIWKRVEEEFGGKWHCVGGGGKFAIQSTGERSFQLKAAYEDMEYICWKYYCDHYNNEKIVISSSQEAGK